MRRNNYKTAWEGIIDFSASFNYYLNNLISIGLSCFRWNNLPESIDKNYFERELLFNGNILFFRDEFFGYTVMKSANGGAFNIYDIPTERNVISPSGYTNTLYDYNSVIIYDNVNRSCSYPSIEFFAKSLASVDIISKINLMAQKNPYIILSDVTEKLSFENLFNKLDSFSPVVFLKKNFNMDSMNVLTTNCEYLGEQFRREKNEILKEAYSFLGVSTINSEKKERMIESEVELSNEANFAQRQARLRARQNACEEINNIFGLNISCEYDTGVNYGNLHIDDEADM